MPFEGFENPTEMVAKYHLNPLPVCQYPSTPGVAGGESCGWFKVGVDTPPKDGIKFKWWIIK